MPLPDPPKSYLLIQVEPVLNPESIAMAKLGIKAPGAGMSNYFDKVHPKYHTALPFDKDDELIGQSRLPKFDNSTDLTEAQTLIDAEFTGNQEALADIFNVIGLADFNHLDHGYIKTVMLYPTVEALAFIEAAMDEWIASYGTSRFTVCGHSLDLQGRPIPYSQQQARDWIDSQITAQKLQNRAGVNLWEV